MRRGSARAADVVVVGGGITGMCTALELAEAGLRVRLLERGAPAAMQTGWTLGGVRCSGRDPAELPLAMTSAERWAALDARLGAPTGYRRTGNLRLARDAAELEALGHMVAEQRALGLDLELIEDPGRLRELAPALGAHIVGASWCPGDGQAEPAMVAAALVAALGARGVDMRWGECAASIELARGRACAVRTARERHEAGAVVLAAGVHAPELLAPLGIELPMATPRVAAASTRSLRPLLQPVLGCADAIVALRQQIDGRFRITGGSAIMPAAAPDEFAAPQPTAGGLAAVLGRVAEIVPALAQAPIERVWAGVIDLTPDALPVIDHVGGVDGLFVAAGFSGHGFALGPGVGECLRDLVLGRVPPVDLAPFALSRFGRAAGTAVPAELHG